MGPSGSHQLWTGKICANCEKELNQDNLVVAKNLSFDRVDVYEIMRKPVLTLHPETDIHHAINIINRFKISRAAVLDDARTLLIIVTLRDMVLRYAVAREGGQ